MVRGWFSQSMLPLPKTALQARVDQAEVGGEQRAEHDRDCHRAGDVGQEVGADHAVAQSLDPGVDEGRQRDRHQVLRHARGDREPQRVVQRLPEPLVLQREGEVVQPTKSIAPRPLVGLPRLECEVEREQQREDAEHREQHQERADQHVGGPPAAGGEAKWVRSGLASAVARRSQQALGIGQRLAMSLPWSSTLSSSVPITSSAKLFCLCTAGGDAPRGVAPQQARRLAAEEGQRLLEERVVVRLEQRREGILGLEGGELQLAVQRQQLDQLPGQRLVRAGAAWLGIA